MAKYQIVEIRRGLAAIYCSDDKLIAEVLADIKKIVPTADKREIGFNFVLFHKLQGKDAEIAKWLIEWVNEHNFEPFTIYTVSEGVNGQTNGIVYCFKRMIEE